MSDRAYRDDEFAHPEVACDLVMKGGITSGAVYPLALTELAKRYRFANIGGTSAGAIAAAAAAAAEYGRHVPGAGFVRLAKVPAELGKILFKLFQPSPSVAPLFALLVAALKAKSTLGKIVYIAATAIWAFLTWTVVALVLSAAIAYLLWDFGQISTGAAIFLFLLLLLIGLIIGVLVPLGRIVGTGLTKNNYGLCPGIRQPGYSGPALTDWLADTIDRIAGRDPARDDPLTFGDLLSPAPAGRLPIILRMMTTNLMMSRPYTLPLDTRIYKFRKDEFERLFPSRIMDFLLRVCKPFKPEAGERGEFYEFPTADKLPLVVAARMSLSFPILICAVPLHTEDWTMKGDYAKPLRLCLFSDGGLSSNFPIQFFDYLLPNSPTFGISLGQYDVRRDRNAEPGSRDDACVNRVWMPKPTEANSGWLLPIQPFSGLVEFLSRLVDAAKDWQDNMQSTLAGTRERIVSVFLKPDEGGLNIDMPSDLVARLAEYGACAGDKLRDEFDLDEHRWRRFLVTMDRLDHSLEEILAAYAGVPGAPESFAKFLARYPEHAASYRRVLKYLDVLRSRASSLAELATQWSGQPQIPDADLPHPKTDMRITPKT